MNILITGIAGFVGSRIAAYLRAADSSHQIFGIDNLSRPGSQTNIAALSKLGVQFHRGDVRFPADLDACPPVGWVIDCAADPRVLAGVSGDTRTLVDTNLGGTLNLLEKCRRDCSGFILISTSRVYSIETMSKIPLKATATRLDLDIRQAVPGLSADGIGETFSTMPPLSLYGATKLASEIMALEYAHNFDLPVWINRCGVIGGAGQFATLEQGIVTYWLHAWHARAPLKYIGFGGQGLQVRDCLHPDDLARLVAAQLKSGSAAGKPRICNAAGGRRNSFSLAELSAWCAARFGPHELQCEGENRRLDVPWTVLDCRRAQDAWGWTPEVGLEQILSGIAEHAIAHPNWLRDFS